MIINIPNPGTLILQGGDEIVAWRETLKRRVPGYFFTKAFRDGYWDGYTRVGKISQKGSYVKLVCGRGLLHSVRSYIEENNLPQPKYRLGFDPIDKPDISKIDKETWEMLRDFQQDAISNTVNQRWGRVALATNAGKGAVIALTAQILTPHKTLILADEISVFQALEGELQKWTDHDIGLVEGGAKKIPDEQIVLGMAPTIAKRIKSKDNKVGAEWRNWLSSFRALLLDEADRATSKTWTSILSKASNSEIRVGFSGSFPKEGTIDEIQLMETIGPELIKVKNIELVDRGISAKPKVEIYNYKSVCSENLEKADLHYVYEKLVVTNQARNEFLVSTLPKEGPVAVIVQYIEHGKILNNLIPNSHFIYGETSASKRKQILEDFHQNKFRVLITSSVTDRGSNLLGYVECLAFASGMGSNRQVIQRMGRGLRRGGGKKEIIIKDYYDEAHKFLVNSVEKRLKVYREEGFEIVKV